jgi:hypothetical protein
MVHDVNGVDPESTLANGRIDIDLADVSYAAAPENKALQQIFELIKIGALPIVTLLITFYFPNGTR